jgi:ribonuclease D
METFKDAPAKTIPIVAVMHDINPNPLTAHEKGMKVAGGKKFTLDDQIKMKALFSYPEELKDFDQPSVKTDPLKDEQLTKYLEEFKKKFQSIAENSKVSSVIEAERVLPTIIGEDIFAKFKTNIVTSRIKEII